MAKAKAKPEHTQWAEDNAKGREEAVALIDKMIETNNPLLLRAKLDELMASDERGRFVGFVQQFAEDFMRARR